MKEIALFKDVIKRLLKKLHLKYLLRLDNKLEKLQLKLQELLDTSMLVPLSSFLTLKQINFISWKWILDFKWSIQ